MTRRVAIALAAAVGGCAAVVTGYLPALHAAQTAHAPSAAASWFRIAVGDRPK